MVARGVRSRALRAHPSYRLCSALVRYMIIVKENWFYRSLSPLGRRHLELAVQVLSILLVKAALRKRAGA
jgi:hypothetical protein